MVASDALGNRLLDKLGRAKRAEMARQCETIHLLRGDVVSNRGDPITHVYFPQDCFVSMQVLVDGYPHLQVGMIGNEGSIGASAAHGVMRSPFRILVEGSGHAIRMRAGRLTSTLLAEARLRKVLGLYHHVVTEQLAHVSACIGFHRLEARLACWLLMSQDRAHADRFPVLQAHVAEMLGVHRSAVSAAASNLRADGSIRYFRGDLTVRDRGALERSSCRCYASAREMYDRVFG